MPKPTVMGLILQKLDNLEEKMDRMATVSLPKVVTEVAVMKAEAVAEAKSTSRIHGAVWGGLTLIVSLVGLALAYYK